MDGTIYLRAKSRVKEETKMPYGFDWDWILDLIKDKDKKEEE